ncbi:MAG: FAD-binding protein [Gammaproteobacteria bacterium]|nr:MAG: FAD-binding protein [Gammaproteobacteria bacterium]
MKLVIIGAGIAGLTLALACQRAGIEVKLYDKAKKLRHIGGGLLLWPHGIRYLTELGLADCLTPYRVSVKGCRMVGTEGQQIFNADYTSFYSLIGGEVLPIDRGLFQQLLANQLAESILELNKQCIEVRHDAHQATVLFSDGTQESADVVVGADGIYSVIRKYVHDHVTEYTNNCWWGGIAERKYVPSLVSDEVFVAIGKGKMCIAWPIHGDRFMWYLPIKMPEKELAPKEAGITQVQSLCADWNEEVQRIISAPASAQRFHLPLYTLSPHAIRSTSRITLIGDAAHALGPILGQGANQAIEDAYVLIHCLQNHVHSIPRALQQYDILRHERAQRLFELENQSATTMINDDLAALEAFLDLATIYQDLIPLVDEKAYQILKNSFLPS